MWICLNDGFFSIVAHKDPKDDRLVVRARRQGDLERVFGVEGQASPGRDYAYRAYMERDAVAAVVMCRVLGTTATNFKDSVKDPELHDAYMATWHAMGRIQVGGPYGHGKHRRGASRSQQRLFEKFGGRGPHEPDTSIDLRDLDHGFGLAFPLEELPD